MVSLLAINVYYGKYKSDHGAVWANVVTKISNISLFIVAICG